MSQKKRENVKCKIFLLDYSKKSAWVFLFIVFWGFLVDVWKSTTLTVKENVFRKCLNEWMIKQISSSFLVIASVKTAELEVIGWKSFTVYFKQTQGWLLFCTKENCHAYKYKVTNNDQNRPRKGLECKLMKLPMWSLFYSACK